MGAIGRSRVARVPANDLTKSNDADATHPVLSWKTLRFCLGERLAHMVRSQLERKPVAMSLRRQSALASTSLLSLLSILSVLATACTAPEASDDDVGAGEAAASSFTGVTAEVRRQYIAKAAIWDEAEYAKLPTKDLKAGPSSNDGFAFNEEVTCKFVEPSKPKELGGKTPKFQCALASGKVLKVKYSGPGRGLDDRDLTRLADDANANPEIYAEVIGTRLMWALGFAADRVYPVRVNCTNCPEQPWDIYSQFRPNQGARAERRFNFAVVEDKFPGKKIETDNWDSEDGQGWAWRGADDAVEEVRAARASEVAAAPREWEALKLLAAFMTHGDNKAANQRLNCDKAGITPQGTCTMPRLILQDIGAGFGSAGDFFGLGYKKADFDAWNGQDLWKDSSGCKAKLTSQHQLKDPVITEEGRAFLGKLMDPQVLTNDHVRQIFEASRITERMKKTGSRLVTVDDWVAAFNKKREALRSRTCAQ